MFRIVVSSLLIILCSFATNSADAGQDKAEVFVSHLIDKVLKIVKDKDRSTEEKEAELVSIFNEAVDAEWMGRFALGKYWRTLTSQQQKDYLDSYRDFLVYSYVPRFREYSDHSVTITGTRQENSDYTVETIIESNGDAPVKVDYRLAAHGKKLKIIDINAEGVSLITTQRSEFASVISRESVDAFIEKITSRARGMKASN